MLSKYYCIQYLGNYDVTVKSFGDILNNQKFYDRGKFPRDKLRITFRNRKYFSFRKVTK